MTQYKIAEVHVAAENKNYYRIIPGPGEYGVGKFSSYEDFLGHLKLVLLLGDTITTPSRKPRILVGKSDVWLVKGIEHELFARLTRDIQNALAGK